MRSFLKTVVIIVGVGICSTLSAQHWGFRVQPAATWQTMGFSPEFVFKPTGALGVNYLYRLNEKSAVSAGLDYSLTTTKGHFSSCQDSRVVVPLLSAYSVFEVPILYHHTIRRRDHFRWAWKWFSGLGYGISTSADEGYSPTGHFNFLSFHAGIRANKPLGDWSEISIGPYYKSMRLPNKCGGRLGTLGLDISFRIKPNKTCY